MNGVEQRYQQALNRVGEACVRCGRERSSVRVIGVTKYVDSELTRQLVSAGCRDLGESRPQSLWQKVADLSDLMESTQPDAQPLQWHMIGHLQRNKVARTIPMIAWLHSLDSLRLAEAVNLQAESNQVPIKVLVEVNVTSDGTKTGMLSSDVPHLMDQLLTMRGLQVRGLMAMSTEQATSDQALREFTAVRELRDHLQTQFGSDVDLSELSMGMSGDFEVAISAGATMVRLGSILWEDPPV